MKNFQNFLTPLLIIGLFLSTFSGPREQKKQVIFLCMELDEFFLLCFDLFCFILFGLHSVGSANICLLKALCHSWFTWCSALGNSINICALVILRVHFYRGTNKNRHLLFSYHPSPSSRYSSALLMLSQDCLLLPFYFYSLKCWFVSSIRYSSQAP